MTDLLIAQQYTYQDDSKIRHQGTLLIKGEDHSLGNVVRQQLLYNPKVKFAGYRKPHPLEEHIEIKVKLHSSHISQLNLFLYLKALINPYNEPL